MVNAVRRIAAFGVAIWGIQFSLAASAATPAPPSPPGTICVDDKGCVTTPDSGGGFKWHPGAYVDPGNYKCEAKHQADDFAAIDEMARVPQIRGVHIRWTWDCLEGNTPGDYSAGFARVDAYLAKLAASGSKRMMLQVWPMGYGACTSTNSSNGVYTNKVYLPEYLIKNSGVDYCYGRERLWTAKLWEPAVMDRLIALSAAYAARYDSHPLFEMFEPHEESVGMVGNESAGFSWSEGQAQWKRLMRATATQWRQTVVHNSVNFMQNDVMVRDQFVSMARPGLTFGTCDTLLDSTRRIPGQLVYRGLNSDGTDNTAWNDLRGSGAWVSRVMWGPLYKAQTPQQTWEYAFNSMRMSHIVWWRQTWYDGTGDQSQQWPAVLEFIKAGKSRVFSTACPSGWTCNTD